MGLVNLMLHFIKCQLLEDNKINVHLSLAGRNSIPECRINLQQVLCFFSQKAQWIDPQQDWRVHSRWNSLGLINFLSSFTEFLQFFIWTDHPTRLLIYNVLKSLTGEWKMVSIFYNVSMTAMLANVADADFQKEYHASQRLPPKWSVKLKGCLKAGPTATLPQHWGLLDQMWISRCWV